jgi:hypothetical protein
MSQERLKAVASIGIEGASSALQDNVNAGFFRDVGKTEAGIYLQ